MFDLFIEIGETLSHNKLRTALTGIAVVWGVFMLIVLLGMSRGVFNAVDSNFSEDRANSMTVYPGRTTKAYKGYSEGRDVELKDADVAALNPATVGNFKSAGATISIDTAKISANNQTISDGLVGGASNYAYEERLDVTAGRFINEMDLRERRRVLVLPKENAEILFGDADKAVGRSVDAMNLSWKVIGVYENEWRRQAVAPFTTVSALQGNSPEVQEISVRLQDIKSVDQANASEEQVRKTLAGRHDFDPEDKNAVYIWNAFEMYEEQTGIKKIMWMAVWIIGLLSLLSGIVGVSNIMFVSVRERTHEIGIRRAIGAKPRSVLIQIIAESVAITTIFGYIGIFLGILVTEGLDSVFGSTQFIKDCTVDMSIALGVTAVLIVTGALAGLFPAMKATKISPVEALRDE